MDRETEENKIFERYGIWINTIIEPISCPKKRILLLIALINSSTIESPLKSLQNTKKELPTYISDKSIVFNTRNYKHLLHSIIVRQFALKSTAIFEKKAPHSKPETTEFINNLTQEEKFFIDKNKQKILFPILIKTLDDLLTQGKKSFSEKISDELNYLSKKTHISWLYLFIFFIFTFLIFYIAYIGWAQKPSINIEFNIGEIIGGLLAGAGVLLAGKAYAQKALFDQKEKQTKND